MPPDDDQGEMDRRLGVPPAPTAPAQVQARRKNQPTGFGSIAALVVLGILAWNWFGSGSNPAAPIQPGSNDVAGTQVPTPATEATIASIVASYAEQYSNAPNEMIAGGTRPARAQALCRDLPRSLAVNRWIGRISTLSSNEQGKGVLVLRVSNNMSLGTWNNALSDIQDHTLIQPNSGLFDTASSMKVGDLVWFSGSFVPSANDCIEEQSLTMSGGMTDPTFTFRFTSLGPLASGSQ